MTEKSNAFEDSEYAWKFRREIEKLNEITGRNTLVNVVSTPLLVNDEIGCLQSLEQALTTMEHQANGVVDRKVVVEVKYGKQVYVATQDRQGKVSLTPRNKDGQITKASESIFSFYKRITQHLKQSYGIVSDEGRLEELLCSTAQVLVAYADASAERSRYASDLEAEFKESEKWRKHYSVELDRLRKELDDRVNRAAFKWMFIGVVSGGLLVVVGVVLAGMLTNTIQ